MGDEADDTRRRFLRLSSTAAILGLAGCGGGGGPAEESPTEAETTVAETTAAETTAASQDEVPEEYVTATAIGGQERSPDALSSKEAVNYQDEPNEGNQCDGCTFYIEDMNGDGLGACAIVAGTIDPEGWCVSYAAHEG
jgi:hypothetical protein